MRTPGSRCYESTDPSFTRLKQRLKKKPRIWTRFLISEVLSLRLKPETGAKDGWWDCASMSWVCWNGTLASRWLFPRAGAAPQRHGSDGTGRSGGGQGEDERGGAAGADEEEPGGFVSAGQEEGAAVALLLLS